MFILFCIAICLHAISRNLIDSINVPIGCILESAYADNEIAFRVAIDMVNERYKSIDYFITPVILNLESEQIIDSHEAVIGLTWNRPFEALELTCSLLKSGVVGVLSLVSETNANTMQSVCDAKEIPLIRTTPNVAYERDCCSINIYPSSSILAKAFADLVKSRDWSSFTVMYESDDYFITLAEIFKMYSNNRHVLILKELIKSDFGDYRDSLKRIRDSGQRNFVLHCKTQNVDEILLQAQEVGLMTRRYSYVITDLDLHTVNLRRYQHSEANLFSFQLINPSKLSTIEFMEAMHEKRKQLNLTLKDFSPASTAAWKLKTTTALLVDAVRLYVEALRDIGSFKVANLRCNFSNSWEHGSSVLNFLKLKTIHGLTGLVQFDHHGLRSDFVLDIMKLEETGLEVIGSWNTKKGLWFTKGAIDDDADQINMRYRSFNVMIAWSEPYALYRNETTNLKGNDQYEGFVVDLIHEISLMEGFNYTLLRNVDDKNGDYNNVTNTWNGMIGDILAGTGDVAIGDITITRQRQAFVDFTSPFMSAGIQILYPKAVKPTPAFFSFAGPFSSNVWLLIVVSYFVVSFTLYVIARFCPVEWDNWDSCVTKPKYYVNQFNVRNSLWYVLGSLMQQGADVAPRSISTRILASVWAFFILVIVSYYKAQLAASLTVEDNFMPFNNIEELVEKADELGIRYGAIKDEVAHQFFMQSPLELHKKIADYMEKHPEYMVEDNYGGYLLAEEGNYAFFTDSIFADFLSSAVCFLKPIGDPINEQNFAIALRKGSPYRAAFSNAILKLLESGKVKELQIKWWEAPMFHEAECQADNSDPIAPPLNYDHVAGIFWITLGGVFLAYMLVFVEMVVCVFCKCGRNYKTFRKVILAELRFYFSFKNGNKPLKDGKIANSESFQEDEILET